MKWQLGICDDETKYHIELEELCKTYASTNHIDIEFCFFHSAEELLEYNYTINVLFLDIEMNGLSGIDILPNLRARYNIQHIIFVTTHSESVFDTLGTKTVGFLSKPINSNRLYGFLDMIKDEELSNIIIDFVTDKINNKKNYVNTQNIIYLKAAQNYSYVYTTDNPNGFLAYENISYWENSLKIYGFIRIQKSYVVNLYYTETIDTHAVLPLTNGLKFTIGRKYRESAKRIQSEYFLEERRRIHNAYK